MKTTRDIKSSLELGRKQKVPSRTLFIEEKLKKELVEEFGDVLSTEERTEIEEKEMGRVEDYSLALKKSKMKILRAKEKAMIVQEMRSGKEMKGDPGERRAKVKTKPTSSKKRDLNEIHFEY
ncbi:MAG: hypothetical protein IBX41_04185 [Methanophagales archaeon]|nr:hypothetical protein [Methanophagales archaeon]